MRNKTQRWWEPLDGNLSTDICRDLALSHALEGGAIGRNIIKLVRADDLRGLCEFDLKLNERGWDIHELKSCRQALAFFSKNEDLVIPGVDKEQAALDKFWASEDACRETNRIFRQWARGGISFSPKVEGQLLLAQRLIARVLGPVPALDALKLRFGKGATTTIRKRHASIREKLSAGLSCSGELAVRLNPLLRELPALAMAHSTRTKVSFTGAWRGTDYDEHLRTHGFAQYGDCEVDFSVPVAVVPGKLNFAVKNALTYRTTLAEPTLNGMGQMAIGDYMMSREKRFGLDLKDQTRNQNLALFGSLTGKIATLDLVSASDMEATELVAHLLPLDWFLFLSGFRTGTIEVDGKPVRLEKFSSMGNGFTFPLESLIFWALTIAVCGESEMVSVFGDDIICPAEFAKEVIHLLAVCGFVVNEKKSFLEGPFRESCGADYYDGVPVRPHFVRNHLSGAGLFLLHNNYKRAGDEARAQLVLGRIPITMRRFGPDGYGDGHLVSDDDGGPLPDNLARKGFSGKVFSTYTVKPVWDLRAPQVGDSVLPLYTVYRSQPADFGSPYFKKESILERVLDNLVGATSRPNMGPFAAKFLRGLGVVSAGIAAKCASMRVLTLDEEIECYLSMALDGASYEEAFGNYPVHHVTGSSLPVTDESAVTCTETQVYLLG